ncbi:MAG: polysaccharide deacetylase family protein [Myxococcota bacterium]
MVLHERTRHWIRRAAQAAACATAMAAGAGAASLVDLQQARAAQPVRVVTEAPVFAPTPREEPLFYRAPEEPDPTLPEVNWSESATVIGGTPHRLIHFTFDDGPSRNTTPRLLEELDRLGIKATFFITTGRMATPGQRAREERAILANIAERGHRIGNHTITHRQLPLLTPAEVLEEVRGAGDLIEEVTGLRPTMMRPPGGSRSARIDAALQSLGLSQLMWNLGSGDSQVRDSEQVLTTFRRVLRRREREHGERGGIVLLHDTHAWSVDAFPKIVDFLRSENCKLLERGEELFDIVDTPDAFFVHRDDVPGDATMAEPPADWLAHRQSQLRQSTRQRCGLLAANQAD